MTQGIQPYFKTINPTHEVHHLTNQMTHDFALRPIDSSILKQDSNSIICLCKKRIAPIDLPFLFAFQTATKNNMVAFLYSFICL
jgi:hypothetical protein